MAEDAPFDPYFAVREPLASKRLAKVGVLEDANAPFGSAPSFLQETETFVFELFLEFGHGARADTVDDVEFFEDGLAAHENVDVGFVLTEDFVGVGYATFADDAFMCLLDGLGQLVEDVLDAIKDDLCFEFATASLTPAFFEQGVVVARMNCSGGPM